MRFAECKPSIASRASTIEAVMDFAEPSQLSQSRAPCGQLKIESGNSATTDLDEAPSSFLGSGAPYMYIQDSYI